MLPLFCLLPAVLRRLKFAEANPSLCSRTGLPQARPAATCLLFAVYCLLFLATPSLSAQGGWAATYGGSGNDQASSIRQTSDGGYIVAGETESFGAGNYDLWVLKLKPDGAVEWQKTYGGRGGDNAESIQQTSDGGYIVVGWTGSFGAGGRACWVLKLAPDGTVEWQRVYGVDGGARSIQQVLDGGYVVAGLTRSISPEDKPMYDLWVLKLRPDGTVQWQKTYGGVKDAMANSIHPTSDGGYIVAGMAKSFGAYTYDFWVLKLRPDGAVEWQKTYGGDLDDWAHSIQQTSDGGYIVAGKTGSFGAGGTNVWVLRLRPNGTVEWQKIYRRRGYRSKASSIQQTREGGYVVAGWMEPSGGEGKESLDFWLLKLGPDGAIEWQKAYGGVNDERAESIQQTSDGGYIVAGWTESFGAGQKDIWVIKIGPDDPLHPYYGFIGRTNTSSIDSNATVLDTTAVVRDSKAGLQDSSAKIQDTIVSANFMAK